MKLRPEGRAACALQLLGEESRGWAWTRALQGLMAKEIHLCGDGSALQLVQNLTAAMHEQVEVQRYERFTPLQVGRAAVAGICMQRAADMCMCSYLSAFWSSSCQVHALRLCDISLYLFSAATSSCNFGPAGNCLAVNICSLCCLSLQRFE